MFRVKDFYAKKVFDIKGCKLGLISDLYVDFYNSRLQGLAISRKKMFSNKNYIKIESVISIDEEILVSKIESGEGLKLKNILGLDVININGNMRGVLEDILIDEEDFTIKGLIVSTGLIDRLINGKDIIIPKECILGENYILYANRIDISFKTMPKRLG